MGVKLWIDDFWLHLDFERALTQLLQALYLLVGEIIGSESIGAVCVTWM